MLCEHAWFASACTTCRAASVVHEEHPPLTVFVWGRALVIGGVCHRIGAKTPCGFAKSTHPPVAAVAPEAALDDLPLHWTEAVLATVHSEI